MFGVKADATDPRIQTAALPSLDLPSERPQSQQQHLPRQDHIETTFSPSDPLHPHRLSRIKKWRIVLLLCGQTLNAGYTSAVTSPAFSSIAEEFHCSRLVATLSVSLFIIGLGIGPMLFAPLSEFYGRRPIYLVSLLLFIAWLVPCARAQNIQTLLVSRFLDGMSGSAFTSVAGGSVGDIFSRNELLWPMLLFTASPLYVQLSPCPSQLKISVFWSKPEYPFQYHSS